MRNENLKEALASFPYIGELASVVPYGSGHINDTYLATFKLGELGEINTILQRINTSIFKDPIKLMENISSVTEHLKNKIVKKGGNVLRETLNVIKTKNNLPYFKDSNGNFWRSYVFITDATSYDTPENTHDFYETGKSFGNFQKLLSDFPAERLHETIAGFHDTRARFAVFKDAVQNDICNRADSVRDEIDFFLSRENIANYFYNTKLPLRVTHNDTKLNNIMIDNKTRTGVCVIDLDTVMPGLAVNDFGDSIRFGASTATEDERDLSKVSCDLEMFEAYTKGFLECSDRSLTDIEINNLPMGVIVMTYECGMRFLTDYLSGDTYFRIHREGHNLDRARTQIKLVADMENKLDKMNAIIKKHK